jgi:hypothetical protein
MTIQATHYGTLAIIIIAAVLGVFMITSGVRTFRRRGRGARDGAASADPAGSPGGPRDPGQVPPDASRASHDAALHQPDWPAEQEEADTVMPDQITTGRFTTGRTRTGRITTGRANGHDPSEAEETDDYAWAPGWTDRR